MEAKSLRIGNFLHNTDTMSPLQITAMDIVETVQCELAGTDSYLEPIPLTEEWLLKFGFKQNENSENWWNKNADCSIDVELTPSSNGIQPLFYYRLSPQRRKSIVYIHQLQNLYFALTGEELEIKKVN